MNSSADAPDAHDGGRTVMRSTKTYEHEHLKYDENQKIREVSKTRISHKTEMLVQQSTSYNWLWLIVMVLIIFGVCVIVWRSQNVYAEHLDHADRMLCSFDAYNEEFPNQDKILWKSLEHGVESVLNQIPTKPSIFLLAYQDAESANKITKVIVDRTTACMKSKANAVELSPDDLKSNEMKTDYGIVVAKYRNQLQRSGVMLVKDLNKVTAIFYLPVLWLIIASFHLNRFQRKLCQHSIHFAMPTIHWSIVP